ncbi:hypothetical protein D3C72_2339320 [compost metagenome]
MRHVLDALFLAAHRGRAEDRAEHAGLGAHVAPHHHVLERSHLAEQADVLERARDAGPGDLMHGGRLVGLAAQHELA